MSDVFSAWTKDRAAAYAKARDMLHLAVQWPSKAGRAFVPERVDDSHSALNWDPKHQALMSIEFPTAHGCARVGFSLDRRVLLIEADRGWPITVEIDGESPDDVNTAFAAAIGELGLDPADLPRVLPYDHELPKDVVTFAMKDASEFFDGLCAFYARGHDALSIVRSMEGGGPARFWPHHIDIASLIAIDRTGDENDRSIGAGLSPGEGETPTPYVYVTPWPYPTKDALPSAPKPFEWHTEGYVALNAPYAAFAEFDAEGFAETIRTAISVCRSVLETD